MTRNRRRKAAIRAHQAEIGIPYMVARRQLGEPNPPAGTSTDEIPAGVEILPPLNSWTRPRDCRWWVQMAAQHGPLMALTISQGPGWWTLDDVVRDVVGASQDLRTDERDLWTLLDFGPYFVTKREHLPSVAAALDAAGALPRLTVRAVPDAAHCDHASCRRHRGELPLQPAVTPPTPAPRRTVPLKPVLSLAEVMQQHPLLNDSGIGIAWQRGQTSEQRRAELADRRRMLAEREDFVLGIATWLRANVTPIKTPKVNSYYMKHVVETAIGRYVSNGQLIAAALIAGYSHQYGTDSPNVGLGMSARDLKPITTMR